MMTMTPRIRKLMLLQHITVSVVDCTVAAYLALVVAAMKGQDIQTLRAFGLPLS